MKNHKYLITLTRGDEEITVEYELSPLYCETAIADHLAFLRDLKIYNRIYAKLLNPVYMTDWYYDSKEEDAFEDEEED